MLALEWLRQFLSAWVDQVSYQTAKILLGPVAASIFEMSVCHVKRQLKVERPA